MTTTSTLRPGSQSGTGGSRSYAALVAAAAALPPVGLDDVLAAASLQTRIDRKYLLSPEQFREVIALLSPRFSVLEVDLLRLFRYESIYFDTPDRDLYRSHQQGRRRRFKVRSRTYLDNEECMFEVKLKGRRDSTVKYRMPYAVADRGSLNGAAEAYLRDLLAEHYGCCAPALERSLTITYARSTLVDLEGGARLTCDVDIACFDGVNDADGPDRILVESKSMGGAALGDRALAGIGVRPISLSKYCVGTALLHPNLPANRWNRVLRRDFGWERA